MGVRQGVCWGGGKLKGGLFTAKSDAVKEH